MLYSRLTEEEILKPAFCSAAVAASCSMFFTSGTVAVAIPEGCAGLVLPRSGLAARHGISVVNAPGLIDSGYRGEVRVLLLNTDRSEAFDIDVGDRIAQLLVTPFAAPDLEEAGDLDQTVRGVGGFGSSGR